MQHLFRTMGDRPDAICSAYVEAEREGEVARPCGAELLRPTTHARILYDEGKLRGWLKP